MSKSIFFYIFSKTNDKDLEIFKIQVHDIILPWVAEGVPKSYTFMGKA